MLRRLRRGWPRSFSNFKGEPVNRFCSAATLRCAAVVLGLAPFAVPSTASAGELTDVIDAADKDDPFDLNIEVIYDRQLKRAKITREFHCDPASGNNRITGCPEAGPEGALVNVKELRYERVTQTLTPRIRVGLYHDLELRIDAPIVLEDTQSLRLAGDGGDPNGIAVTPETSSILDDENGNLFPVPMSSDDRLPTRAGFGDMTLWLRWSPVSQSRDEQRGNWTLEFGYRMPTGQVMEFGNTGVGRGVHELIFATGLSRRYTYVEPYARYEFVQPLIGDHPLFKDYGGEQNHVGPGLRTGFDLGMEIVPYDDQEKNVKFWFDIGFGATYHAEGRDYSELFDALALGAQEAGCSNPSLLNCGRYNPDSSSTVAGTPHDGITVVEDYMNFRAHIAMGLQASQYLRFLTRASIAHNTEHFLSTADVGSDLDGSGVVDQANEQNPVYVPAIDTVGQRLRIEETTIFTVALSAAVMF
ncbi:MAG: hypothetical protein ACE366_26070 [Bradymonadia bacterium]